MRTRILVASMLFTIVALVSTAAVAMTVYMKNDEQIDAESAWQAKGKVFVKVNNDLILDFPADEVDLEKTFARKTRMLKSKAKAATVAAALLPRPAAIGMSLATSTATDGVRAPVRCTMASNARSTAFFPRTGGVL